MLTIKMLRQICRQASFTTRNYDTDAVWQLLSAQETQDTLTQALKAIPPYSEIKIADIASSFGRNSFAAFTNPLNQFRADRQDKIDYFFSDLPINNWNKVVTNFLQHPESFQNIPNLRMHMTPGSFYQQLFPDESIDLSYSGHALHWLAKFTPNPKSPFLLSDDPVLQAQYVTEHKGSLREILDIRAKELKKGGQLIFTHVTDLENTLFYQEAFEQCAQEGLITWEQIGKIQIPIRSLTLDQFFETVEENGKFEVVSGVKRYNPLVQFEVDEALNAFARSLATSLVILFSRVLNAPQDKVELFAQKYFEFVAQISKEKIKSGRKLEDSIPHYVRFHLRKVQVRKQLFPIYRYKIYQKVTSKFGRQIINHYRKVFNSTFISKQ